MMSMHVEFFSDLYYEDRYFLPHGHVVVKVVVSYLRKQVDEGRGGDWSVAANETGILNVTFDPNQLYEDTYTGNLILHHNDPLQDSLQVSLTMNLTGTPNIEIDETYIEFPETVVFNANSYLMNVHNTGTEAS